MAILALMVSQIAVPKGKKKVKVKKWSSGWPSRYGFTAELSEPGGRGVRGSIHPTSTKGGIIPTTLLPPSWTFRPSYGPVTANAMASGRMRCNGTLIFVAECYTTMEWNSFWWSIPICIWVEFETHFFSSIACNHPKLQQLVGD